MRIAGLSPATNQPITVEIRDGLIAAIEPGVVRADHGDAEHYLSAVLVDVQHNG